MVLIPVCIILFSSSLGNQSLMLITFSILIPKNAQMSIANIFAFLLDNLFWEFHLSK